MSKKKKMTKEEKQKRESKILFLESAIHLSRCAITKQGSYADEFLNNQANRLEEELKKIKNNS